MAKHSCICSTIFALTGVEIWSVRFIRVTTHSTSTTKTDAASSETCFRLNYIKYIFCVSSFTSIAICLHLATKYAKQLLPAFSEMQRCEDSEEKGWAITERENKIAEKKANGATSSKNASQTSTIVGDGFGLNTLQTCILKKIIMDDLEEPSRPWFCFLFLFAFEEIFQSKENEKKTRLLVYPAIRLHQKFYCFVKPQNRWMPSEVNASWVWPKRWARLFRSWNVKTLSGL